MGFLNCPRSPNCSGDPGEEEEVVNKAAVKKAENVESLMLSRRLNLIIVRCHLSGLRTLLNSRLARGMIH